MGRAESGQLRFAAVYQSVIPFKAQEASRLTLGIVWFRQDLRLSDNAALHAALHDCERVLPVFIADDRDGTVSEIGAASRVWLHASLNALENDLKEAGSTLLVLSGDPLKLLPRLAKTLEADGVYWNRSYDPVTCERDKSVKEALHSIGANSYLANLLFEPVKTLKADGTPYRVFTPYWKNLMGSLPGEKPLAAPKNIPSPTPQWLGKQLKNTIAVDSIDELKLQPAHDWGEVMMAHWSVGEKAAQKRLKDFLKSDVQSYKVDRDIPSMTGTSMLSPHLHFGEISPRQIISATFNKRKSVFDLSPGEETFVKEVVWREFAHNLIYQFPHTVDSPLDERFNQFPWASKYDDSLKAWQQGNTGIPIVDAGMRQLYATGWMHNRVRMVVASFLIKNLLIPWQEGERWFRHTLVDADVASNAMGWQWAAGSGADAAPFFRVFNPVLQGEKFDKEGAYVRHWVPELESVANKFVHKPWELPREERDALDYAKPLVDLKKSRQAALDAFAEIKTAKS